MFLKIRLLVISVFLIAVVFSVSAEVTEADKKHAQGFFQLLAQPVRLWDIYRELKEVTEKLTPAGLQTVENLKEKVNVQFDSERKLTPLMLVGWLNANPAVLEVLLEAGADLEVRNEHDETALMWAARNRDVTAMAEFLLARGAELEAKDRYGQTALHHASRGNNENPELTKFLLDAGADVTRRDNGGRTALMSALSNYEGSVRQVEILLEAGADPEATDEDGRTPLMYGAMGTLKTGPLQLLIDAGADLEATDNDHEMTPLLFAVSYDRWPEREVWKTMINNKILFLLDAGADVTAVDNEGHNAWDLIQGNEKLKGTEAYQRLNPAN